MLLLSSTPHKNTRYMLSVNYEQLYKRLSQVLEPEQLSLFAIPTFGSSESHWHTAIGKSPISLDQCTDDQKDLAADILRQKKEHVEATLAKVDELSNYINVIFDVPSSNNIHIVTLENGEIDVVLSQWACRESQDYTGVGSVGSLLDRPKSNHTQVEVLVTYSDGTISTDRNYYFKYKNRAPQVFKPNSQGKKSFGQIKNGETFAISPNEGDSPFEQSFNVIEGKKLYEAQFPYFVNATIKVKNQLGDAVRGLEVKISTSEGSNIYNTNDDGEIFIDGIRLNDTPLKISCQDNPNAEYVLGKSDNQFVYTITERILRQPIITVVDKDGVVVPDYPLLIKYDDSQSTFHSDADGLAHLGLFDLEKEIEVLDGNNEYNNLQLVVKEEENDFTLEVDPPKEKEVTLRFLNHKKSPLSKNAVDVTIGKELFQRQTNEKGEVYFSDSLFTDGKKFKVAIRNSKNDKVKSKKTIYKVDQDLYEFRLKKFNWWWLLLLLIPLLLLLLLTFEKDVYVKAISPENTPVANAITTFKYKESFAYNEGSFFPSKTYQKTDTTNIRGEIKYEKLNYSVYSMLFKFYENAKIEAESDCYVSDTITENYHLLSLFKTDTIVLKMKPKVADLKYAIIDKESGLPLNNAIVYYENAMDNEVVIDSVKSNANGEVIIKNLPICGTMNLLKAKVNGYKDFESIDVSYEDIQNDPTLAICPLIPLKERIEFFVVHCETNEPIPDVEATITIRDNQSKSTQTAHTNIDGMGRGTYDELRILSRIQIDVDRKYFKPNRLKREYTVEEFIKLPDSLRTICLLPEANAIDFRVVDSVSKAPIPGAMNYVEITTPQGDKLDNVISNRNGSFTISEVKVGDKISIKTLKDPEYYDNDYTIKNADAINLLDGNENDRTIPLAPKELNLKFKTLDKIDRSIIPMVNLKVYLNNQQLDHIDMSDQDGEFMIRAMYNDVLTIVAEKDGFDKNIQISNVAFKDVQQENLREILLEIPPCTTQSVSHRDSGNSIRQYDMQQVAGAFEFQYYTNTLADEIIVFDGKIDDPNKTQIFYFNDATGAGSRNIRKENLQYTSRYITVVVNGNTEWVYTVNCSD